MDIESLPPLVRAAWERMGIEGSAMDSAIGALLSAANTPNTTSTRRFARLLINLERLTHGVRAAARALLRPQSLDLEIEWLEGVLELGTELLVPLADALRNAETTIRSEFTPKECARLNETACDMMDLAGTLEDNDATIAAALTARAAQLAKGSADEA